MSSVCVYSDGGREQESKMLSACWFSLVVYCIALLGVELEDILWHISEPYMDLQYKTSPKTSECRV